MLTLKQSSHSTGKNTKKTDHHNCCQWCSHLKPTIDWPEPTIWSTIQWKWAWREKQRYFWTEWWRNISWRRKWSRRIQWKWWKDHSPSRKNKYIKNDFLYLYNHHITQHEPNSLHRENIDSGQQPPYPTPHIQLSTIPTRWPWKWPSIDIWLFSLGIKAFIWPPAVAVGNWDPWWSSARTDERKAIGIYEKLYLVDDELRRGWEIGLAYIGWEITSLPPLKMP